MTLLPTTIIFDFGGVLLDWRPMAIYADYFGGDQKALERFFEEIDFHQWNLEQDRGRPFAEGVALLSQQFPQYAHLIGLYHQQWEKSIFGAIEPVVEILAGLKQAGYGLHGLSNFSTEKFPLMRQRFAFFDWFDSILLSGEVGLIKPDEQIFHLALQRIGARAQACVYIDDSFANVLAAKRVGLMAIHYQSPQQLALDLQAVGVQWQGAATQVDYNRKL